MVYCATLYLNGVRDISHNILQILSAPHLQTWPPRALQRKEISTRALVAK